MKIRTNNKPRPVLYGWELDKKEQKEFDYLEFAETPLDDMLDGDWHTFFRYRGQVYDLGEFVRIIHPGKESALCGPCAHFDHANNFACWDGIATDSAFSAMLVRYTDNSGEAIVVGIATW